MNTVGAALADGVQDALSVEIALGRSHPAKGVGLVGQAHMERVPVGVGIDGNSLDSHLFCRTDNPHSDLATVRNQDFREHR